MLATWEHSRGSTLTVTDYLASGGIRDALTRTAEAGLRRPLRRGSARLARRLFLRLVHVADDAPPTRAMVGSANWRPGAARTGPVLGRFVGERLITVDADTAQITHDALLIAWPRLRSWIDAGLENLLTRRRVTEAARAWQDAGREGAALWRGSQLAAARAWAADEDNHASLGSFAGEFVTASIAAEQATKRAERRRTRSLQRLTAALAVLVLAAAALAGFAFQQRHAATSARDDADSREIAVEAGQVRGQDAPLAAQLSVAAYHAAHTPQATASLLESTGAPSAARLLDSAGVSSRSASARTTGTSRSPPRTGRCGSGTWPRPGTRSRPALRWTRPATARCTRPRSVPTGRPWPRPAPDGPSSSGTWAERVSRSASAR